MVRNLRRCAKKSCAMKPSDSEISQLALKMRAWFKMTEVESRERATGFLTIAYGWGSPPSGSDLDRKLKSDLSKQFEWISDDVRVAFEQSEATRLKELEFRISSSPSPPRFRV